MSALAQVAAATGREAEQQVDGDREVRRALDLVERADRAGSFFFSPATMCFWRSRLLNVTWVTGDVARLVTSDRTPDGARRYSVREVRFVADAVSLERADFDTLATYGTARTARRHLLDGVA